MYKKLKNNYLKTILSFALIILGLNLGYSQSVTYEVTAESNVQISGTSSMHDWKMHAPVKNCRIELNGSSAENVLELVNVEFQLLLDQLKSEHKKMDDIALKALKSKEHPTIHFQSNTHLTLTTNGTATVVKGILEIAGTKKEVELTVVAKKDVQSDLIIQFEFPIHMEDYDVEPPSLMFGAITTGSDIIASFELYFNKLNQ